MKESGDDLELERKTRKETSAFIDGKQTFYQEEIFG